MEDVLSDYGTQWIRNIQLIKQDLEPLLPTRTQKITRTTINAYTAFLQDQSFLEKDFCFFSSVIPAIVTSTASEDAKGRSIEGHLIAAGGRDTIRNRPRWAIPLCGGEPAHWVLSWVDFSTSRYGLYNSMPQIRSRAWAEPLFILTCEYVLRYVDTPRPNWRGEGWKFVEIAPLPLRQQVDTWSCGLFVLLAIQEFASPGSDVYAEGREVIEVVKQAVMKELLSLPVFQYQKRRHAELLDATSDSLTPQEPGTERDTVSPDPKQRKATNVRRITSFLGTGSGDHNSTPSPSSTSETGPRVTVELKCKTVAATQSIAHFFAASKAQSSRAGSSESSSTVANGPVDHASPPPSEPHDVPCQHLKGPQYTYYIETTQTRSLGGVSIERHAIEARKLFPYKKLPAMKGAPAPSLIKIEIPPDGNAEISEPKWTSAEHRQLDDVLQSFARWIVDFGAHAIRATQCQLHTTNQSGVCDACEQLRHDTGLQQSLQRSSLMQKEHERKLPEDIHQDPLLYALWTRMKDNDLFRCYLELYQYARAGKLIKHEMNESICKVLSDKVRREDSENPKLKHGIRYTEPYLQFSFMMRGRGQFSAQNYVILGEHIPLPNPRTIRALVSKSDDCLQNPDLHYENISLSGDCTKVRQRVTYSSDFGGHILGSTLALDDCIVKEAADIDRVMECICDEQAYAKQTRAILIKVPQPQIPPFIIALLPTTGKDDTKLIHGYHCRILEMAAQVSLPIITFAADGAASELNAQVMMDNKVSSLPPVMYQYPAFGIMLKAPVFKVTGPVVSVSDPEHARKTARNQLQHGTHMASLGRGYLVYRTLIALNEVPNSGLVLSDVQNVDKQDDSAAHRLFHTEALKATTYKGEDAQTNIEEDFLGLHVFLSVFGLLFDSWLNRRMTARDRVLSALRARFFLHIWWTHIKSLSTFYPDLYSTQRSFISAASFKILNRLCDTLVLLVLIYAEYYPNEAFCPWLLGTNLLEHFFGTARSLVPNFSYPELLKLVKLARKSTGATKECTARSGYILDYDDSPLTADELVRARVKLTRPDLKKLVELAASEAKAISSKILRMRVPRSPWELAPINAPTSRKKNRSTKDDTDDIDTTDSDSDLSDEDFDESSDDDSNAGEDNSDTLQDGSISERTEIAAAEVGRLVALSEDLEATREEIESLQVPSGARLNQPLGAASAKDVKPLTKTGTMHRLNARHDPKDEQSETGTAGPILQSEFVGSTTGDVSIASLLALRTRHQEGTKVRSQRIVQIDSKFHAREKTNATHEPSTWDGATPAVSQMAGTLSGARAAKESVVLDSEWALKKYNDSEMAETTKTVVKTLPSSTSKGMSTSKKAIGVTMKEATHRVRVLQQLQGATPRAISTRTMCWTEVLKGVSCKVPLTVVPNVLGRNISTANPLQIGSTVLMKNKSGRIYVGDVLDILKKVSNCYASVTESTDGKGVTNLSLTVYLECNASEIEPDDDDDYYEDEDADQPSPPPVFLCKDQRCGQEGYLHTHARMQDLVYHFGLIRSILKDGDSGKSAPAKK
ncbi:uncharacterized protein B0H18DRAFT_1122200 [Fomitopsis serialis]|uniref:uncharacterized protein n=1 Tax=Fomitopsis serialis TaxID=139415 RepID=UPI00200898EF|nr:uncharacterized protein B0H18DRAFT_1122200 [Neoantrodia serialis]KAH9919884.1 hypothetical protein B0H18DRAFT_1122200 [Neoantrodia serialis]